MTEALQTHDTQDLREHPTAETPAIATRQGVLRQPYRRIWTIGVIAFLVQAGGLIAWSRHLYSRFDLTSDFATFSQAWNQIGTGHLDPYDTTFAWYYPHYGYPFWQSHFELMMWPLALLRAVGLSSFSLLVVQDLALAGFGLVAFRLGIEIVQKHWDQALSAGPFVALGLLVALLASPWTYWTASFDFHFQPLAAFFLALCARDVWNGRRRAWWWAAAVLLCGDVAASYLLGLGLAAVLSGKGTRRTGLALIGAGVGWILFVVAIGSGKGSSLAINYGYLAHITTPGTGIGATASVIWGIAKHPSGVFSVIHSRWSEVYKFIAASGTIGVASALGFGIGFVVLVPNALNQSGVFVGSIGSFQNLVAVIFMTVGSVTVLTWILHRWNGRVIAPVLGCAALVQVLIVSAIWIPKIPSTFSMVNSPTAGQLSQVQQRIPADAEAIVSQGVIGRFGSRQLVYPFLDGFANGQTFPVSGRTVAFVFVPHQGIEVATPLQTAKAISQVQQQLHATEIARTPNVTAFLWHPPKGTRSITFSP
jgi:hypothetical protein